VTEESLGAVIEGLECGSEVAEKIALIREKISASLKQRNESAL
jgi:hypothetical protein